MAKRSLWSLSSVGGAAVAAGLVPAAVRSQQVLEEIHVTGVALRASPNELAQSVSVLSGETLSRIRGSNLGETLAGELGVSSSYFGAGSSRPIIRGLAGPRVRMLEDGIDSMDLSTVSDDHAVGIDPLVARQIEIFRGPTTLLYGSGAVGGVINTVTTRIPDTAPEDGLAGAIELRADTVAHDRAAVAALDGGTTRLAWHVDALTRDTRDFEIGAGDDLPRKLGNSDIDTTSGAAGVSWLGDDAFIGMSLSTLDAAYGLPGHAGESADTAVRIDLEQTRVDVKGGWLGVSDRITAVNLRLGVNDYQHVELEGSEIGTRFSNDAYEGRVEVLHAPWGAWTGAVGLHVAERELAAIGEEAFVPPVDTRTWGVFMIEQREWERWRLSAGARAERQTQQPSGGQPRLDGTAATVSAAAIRTLQSGYSVAINFARAERLPVAEELYADGPHLATENFEIGNVDLGAETSHHVDVGVRKSDGARTWSITGFLTDYDDFIFLRDSGIEDSASGLPIFVFDQRNARLHGLEAEFFTPIASFGRGELDVRLFADYVEGELDGGESLPRMPPWRVGVRLQHHSDRAVFGLEATRHGAQNAVAPFETPTRGYTLVAADFNWSLAAAEAKGVDFFVRATNLLDELARKHTSLVKDTTPLPGRNYIVGLRARF